MHRINKLMGNPRMLAVLSLLISLSAFSQTPVYPKDYTVTTESSLSLEWNVISDYSEVFSVQVSESEEFTSILFDFQNLDTNTVDITDLESGTTYFWRVNSDAGPWAGPYKFDVFHPDDMDGLILWLRADSMVYLEGEFIDSIGDISGNGNTFFQNTSSKRPTLTASWKNERPAIRFDGVNDWLTGTGWEHPASDFSFTFVSDKVGTNEARMLFITAGLLQILSHRSDGVYSDGVFTGPSLTSVDPQFFTLNLRQPMQSDVWLGLDQVAQDLGWVGNPVGSSISFGSRLNQGGTFFDGFMSELIVYDHGLNEEDQNLLNGYLQAHYSPPVNLGQDIILNSFCDSILRVDENRFSSILWSDESDADSLVITSPGEYWVSVVDSFGVASVDTIRVLYPGNFIESFQLCLGLDSLWDTGLDDLIYTHIWNVPNSGSSIVISEEASYELIVEDPLGCQLLVPPVVVEIDSFPAELSLGEDVDLCSGNTISLIQGAEEAQGYLWNDVLGEEEFPITVSGTYWVEASNELGCTGQDTIEVNVLGEAPTAGFGFTNTCFAQSVQFVDNSAASPGSSIEQYSWQFGDTGISEVNSPQHEYQSVDTFLVSLSVTTDQGCSDEIIQELIVNPLPAASFEFTTPCNGQEITFTQNSQVPTGGINESEWLFGLSDPAIGDEVGYLFEDPGTYSAQLISITDFGCRDTLEQLVVVNGTPTSFFNTEIVCFGDPSLFQAMPDDTLSGPVNQFLWDFGAATSIFEVTTYTFQTPGLNEVTLTVTSALGCADDTTIVVPVSVDPIPGFEYSPACTGEPIFFMDTTSVSEGDEINEWRWFFDNQDESDQQSPLFTFEFPGLYDVTLIVATEAGCSDEVEQIVEVSELPTSEFSFEPAIGAPPLTPVFENSSEGASGYEWTFDFGQNSMDSIPVHTFTDSGLVAISLMALNAGGCTATSLQTIFLTEPIADLVLLAVEYELDEGLLRPALTIRNIGNFDVESFHIEVEITGGARIIETWNGLLPRNEAIIFPISTALFYNETMDLPFFCVTIIPSDGRVDEDASNNVICKEIGSVDDEVFFFTPSPNPVQEELSISIVNAPKGELFYSVSDMSGKTMLEQKVESQGDLIQHYTINFSSLSSGRYLLKLSIGLKEEVYKIQVLRD